MNDVVDDELEDAFANADRYATFFKPKGYAEAESAKETDAKTLAACESSDDDFSEPTEEELNMLRNRYAAPATSEPVSEFAAYADALARRASSSSSSWSISAARTERSAATQRSAPVQPSFLPPASALSASAMPSAPAAPSPQPSRRPEQSPSSSAIDGNSALDMAAIELCRQLSTSSAMLAAAPSPPPRELLAAIGGCAEAMRKVGAARRALSRRK